MDKIEVTWDDLHEKAIEMTQDIVEDFPKRTKPINVYPIPRGGVYAALVLRNVRSILNLVSFNIVDDILEADVYIDDIIDSGVTKKSYMDLKPLPFYALYKADLDNPTWIVFPWEKVQKEDGPQDNIKRVLQYIGEDVEREGLQETPDRVVKSFDKLYGGYVIDPVSIFKTFENDKCDEMVILKNIEFYSTCEHHMLPFWGRAHLAYIPDKKVIGISKMARLLDIYARRLQIQERICQEVTNALDKHLGTIGSACVLEAQHFCMTARGVQKQNSIMVTSSLTGVFRTNSTVRSEFLTLIK